MRKIDLTDVRECYVDYVNKLIPQLIEWLRKLNEIEEKHCKNVFYEDNEKQYIEEYRRIAQTRCTDGLLSKGLSLQVGSGAPGKYAYCIDEDVEIKVEMKTDNEVIVDIKAKNSVFIGYKFRLLVNEEKEWRVEKIYKISNKEEEQRV